MDGEFRARACRASYRLFLCLWCVPAAPLLLGFFLQKPCAKYPQFLPLLAAPALLLVLILLWLRGFEIRIEDGVLEYKTLFSRRRVVPISDITSAGLDDVENSFTRRGWSLAIRYRTDRQEEVVRVNLKVFSASDVRRLCSLLGAPVDPSLEKFLPRK